MFDDLDPYILTFLIKTLPDDLESLKLVNHHYYTYCVEHIATLAARFGYSSTTKLRTAQLLALGSIGRFIDEPHPFNVLLRTDRSFGKTLIGLTACKAALERDPASIALYFIQPNRIRDFKHECLKHFPTITRRKELLIYTSSRPKIMLEIHVSVIDNKLESLHGKIIAMCMDSKIVTKMAWKIISHSSIVVCDDNFDYVGQSLELFEERKRTLFMSSIDHPAYHWDSVINKHVTRGSAAQTVLFEERIVLKEEDKIKRLLGVPNSYPDKHKLLISYEDMHMYMKYPPNSNVYDYLNITREARETFGYEGGILHARWSHLKQLTNVNECSILFIYHSEYASVPQIASAISKIVCLSNQHRAVKVVYMLSSAPSQRHQLKLHLVKLGATVDPLPWAEHITTKQRDVLFKDVPIPIQLELMLKFKSYLSISTPTLLEMEKLSERSQDIIREIYEANLERLTSRDVENFIAQPPARKLYVLLTMLNAKTVEKECF